jgi:hypothetical protein
MKRTGAMSPKSTYRDWLKQDFGALIDALNLDDLRKHFLRSRWLDQVLWMEGRSDHARRWYYGLRLVTIVGAVIIPALVSLTVSGPALVVVRWVTFGLSLAVAISSAVEEFFHYGDRWRHYRQTVELLKIEGWGFFQLSGPYSRRATHADAYPKFAARVEEIIQRDVQVYISEIVGEAEEKKEEAEQK